MGKHYPNLLSPLKVGSFILKNRMVSSNSMPHFLQGPEPYPSDATITHFANRAKSGASVVTCAGINNEVGGPRLPADLAVSHYPNFNLYNPGSQNYLIQLADAINYYGAIASVGLFSAFNAFPILMPDGRVEIIRVGGEGLFAPAESIAKTINGISENTLEQIADSFAQQCRILKSLNFNMASLHMAYRFQILGQFLSPITNQRKDRFGGNIENRARFPLMVLERIRNKVGPDFLIEVLLSGQEPEGGNTLEDTVVFLKMAEKYIDVVQVRAGEIDPAHPTGFCLEETPYLTDAEYIKKSGVDIFVSSVGGWQDPESAEKALAERKIDIVAMARAWISNPNYGQLVYEDRKDDIVPCLRCNKCHRSSDVDPFVSICAVNPLIGIEHRIDALACKPGPAKKIAVVGGGPAGMKAAIELFDRGHFVTLYEASDQLGGALKHSDHVDFKWPLRNFKNYLIHQVTRRNIHLLLNKAVTPEMLGLENYHDVIVAIGAKAALPKIPGIEKTEWIDPSRAMVHPDVLGKNVVIIGGGEVGVETGMVLAKNGHHVTIIEIRDRLAEDAAPTHFSTMFAAAWKALPKFHPMINCRCTGITEKNVTYMDDHGKKHSIPADNVVLALGMTAKTDEALAFYGTADRFYLIGDCRKPSNIQHAMRSAFATASTI